MIKIRTIGALVVVASAVACASPPAERQASTTQYISTSSEDGGEPSCSHAICATGAALVAACDPCATSLCAQDPYCCSTSWDATCVGEVTAICGLSCTTPPPPPADAGASNCVHPVCATGAPLASSCEPCASQLCAQDPYCCSVTWDATCVGEVTAICGQACN